MKKSPSSASEKPEQNNVYADLRQEFERMFSVDGQSEVFARWIFYVLENESTSHDDIYAVVEAFNAEHKDCQLVEVGNSSTRGDIISVGMKGPYFEIVKTPDEHQRV